MSNGASFLQHIVTVPIDKKFNKNISDFMLGGFGGGNRGGGGGGRNWNNDDRGSYGRDGGRDRGYGKTS